MGILILSKVTFREKEYTVIKKKPAVAMLPVIVDENHLIIGIHLIQQPRPAVNRTTNKIFEVPAGSIEENENIGQALIRELKEETGISLTETCKIFMLERPLYVSPGHSTELIYGSIIFIPKDVYDKKDKELINDDDEDITPLYIGYADLDHVMKNHIEDMKTLCLLYKMKELSNELIMDQ